MARLTTNTKGRVLVVEDEAIVGLHLRTTFEKAGYDVDLASDSEAVLRAVDRCRPDIVVMDIHLPGPFDGISLAEELYVCRDVPVVFLTAFSDEATRTRAASTGAYGFLLKPVALAALESSVELAIAKHAELRAYRQTAEWRRTAMENLRLAVVITAASGIIRHMNRSASELTGRKLVDALGRQPWEGEVFATTPGGPTEDGSVHGVVNAADGTHVRVRAWKIPSQDDSGDCVWVVRPARRKDGAN